LISGSVHGNGNHPVGTLAIDSRTLAPSHSTLFVALTGEQHNGHDYIGELYERGIRSFLVSNLPDLSQFPEAGFCLVKDTLKGLQDLASAHRREFDNTVVGITGSNGKTIVKEWLYQCLSGYFNVYRSPKSYNSQVGVPLSVWMTEKDHQIAILEAGISFPGEMNKLKKIIQPAIGVFTNLGSAHQENFETIQEKLNEKLLLFTDCEKVIIRSDQRIRSRPLLSFLKDVNAQLVTWSLGGEALYTYRIINSTPLHTSVSASLPDAIIQFSLPFGDEASIENALHVFTLIMELGLPVKEAVKRISSLEPVSMRLEMLQGIQGSILINDTYNSDIGGLSAALNLVEQQDNQHGKVVILSDLLQSGMEEKALYSEIADLIQEKEIDQFIGIGPAMMKRRALFHESALFYANTEEFMKRMDQTLFHNRTVLIKGSRKYGFEKITGILQLKTHQTVLEVDLNAMVHNLNYFRSLLEHGVKTMAVVKALSYGTGNVEIANLLQFHKVDYLAVAFIDEGIELRKAGIHLPIMVLNPDPAGFGPMIDYQLEPEVYCFRGLEALYEIAHYRGIAWYPIHLKIDSGMHRLGFQAHEMKQLIPWLKRKEFRLSSIFTHLAASEDPDQDLFSREQIGVLKRIASRLQDELGGDFLTHVLNSAGIERFPDAQFDMVRLGIGLYGIGKAKGLKPVSSFITSISQVRTVSSGETVGYSRRGKVDRDSRIATLPVGYADGLRRSLGNGVGQVWINDHPVPTIGEICMDMTMIDVTGIEAAEGDRVEIFGKQQPVTFLAQLSQTIPYEILTSIPERVKRVYLHE